jgi:two-component system sensor histidine kinase/response regulator
MSSQHWSRSLRFWLLTGSLCGLLLLFGLVSYNTNRVLQSFVMDNTRTTIAQTSETLNLALAPHTTEEGLKTLEAYLRGLVRGEENGIVYLAVLDESGRFLARSEGTPEPLPDVSATPLEAQIGAGIVHVRQNILVADTGIGQLCYGLSTHQAQLANERFRNDSLKLLAGVLVVAALLLTLVGLWVSRQLGQLIQASQALAAGDLTGRVPESGSAEFNQLAMNFNRMAVAVAGRAEIQQQLRISEEKLRATLEQSPNVAVQWHDRQGRVIYWNTASEQLYGWTSEEALGKTLDQLVHTPEKAAEFLRLLDQIAADGERVGPLTQQTHHRSGELRWVDVTLFAIPGETDETPIFVSMNVDVTERMLSDRELAHYREHLEELVSQRTGELRASQRQLETIIENLPAIFFIKDADGRHLMINRNYEIGIGVSKDTALGHTDADIFPPEAVAAIKRVDRQVLESGAPMTFEESVPHADGTYHDYLTTKAPLLDEQGQVSALIGIAVDITTIKTLQKELARARDEAERLMRVKSEFLANMSHEIRTPLNAVLGVARIGVRDSVDAEVQTQFRHILDSGQHLLGIINDILDFSKIEAGRLVIEQRTFQLLVIVEDAIGLLAGPASDKGLMLTTRMAPDLPAWVTGDALRLRQILANLLSNAVKFTMRGQITLTVSRQEHGLLFQVRDTGIGMDSDQIARLFVPFEQADGTTTRRFGGTGLGLAISRDLARLMGGDITAESLPGEGSIFELHLPLPAAQPAPQADRPSPASGPRLAGLRVLAAEDMEINRLILADLLEHEGASVQFAENGRQALDLLEEAGIDGFDVVLMDVQMPVMDGYEATRRLRDMAPDLPVIGLTAHALEAERARCLDAGMVEQVTKPVEPDVLVAAILARITSPVVLAPGPRKDAPAQHAPAEAAVAPPSPESGMDWAALSERFKGRGEFIAKLVRIMLESHRETPQKLRQAIRDGDNGAIAFIAHGIKGAAGNIMARRLQQAAATAEAAARASSPDAPALAEALISALDALLRELAAHNTDPA